VGVCGCVVVCVCVCVCERERDCLRDVKEESTTVWSFAWERHYVCMCVCVRLCVATQANGTHRDEVFVDIIERISVTFNAQGYPLTSEVDGSIMVRTVPCRPPASADWLCGQLWFAP